MTNLNEYLLIANQMQLLERQISEERHREKRSSLYEAKAAFWPTYEKLMTSDF